MQQNKTKLSRVERARVKGIDVHLNHHLASGDGLRHSPESVAIGRKLYHKVCVQEGKRLSPFQQWAFCARAGQNISQQGWQSIAESNVKQVLARLSLGPPQHLRMTDCMPCQSRHAIKMNPCAAHEARGMWQNESLLQESDWSMVYAQERQHRLGETEIVLAYCTKSIEWLGDAVRGLHEKGANVTHVHIVSKCGSTPNTTSLSGLAGLVINVTTRRNVGRNDETFTRFLVDRYETLPTSLFFLKCSTGQQIKELQSKLHISIGHWLANSLATSSVGFACHLFGSIESAGLYHVANKADSFLNHKFIVAHEQNPAAAKALGNFKATWRPLGNFTRHFLSPNTLQHLDAVQHPVRRVCYGGSFATSGRNVLRIPRADWSALSTALLRGDNIEEGHYVERLWAALLSPPVDTSTGATALSYANGRYWQHRMSTDMPGLIIRGCSRQHEDAADDTAQAHIYETTTPMASRGKPAKLKPSQHLCKGSECELKTLVRY